MKCKDTKERICSDEVLRVFLKRGYVLALAGVVLQSVGQMVGVRLPAAPRFLTLRKHGGET